MDPVERRANGFLDVPISGPSGGSLSEKRWREQTIRQPFHPGAIGLEIDDLVDAAGTRRMDHAYSL
jgi:hypothetical protein